MPCTDTFWLGSSGLKLMQRKHELESLLQNLSAANRSAYRVFEGKLLAQNAKENEFKIMHLRSKPTQLESAYTIKSRAT